MRKEGFLTPLNKQTIPREFMFFDTETHMIKVGDNKTDLPFRLGALIKISLDNELRPMKRHVHRFNSELEFYDILDQYKRKNTTIYIFAHNIAFDVIVLDLPNLLTEMGYEHKPPIKNGRQFMWSAKKDGYHLRFLDTANLGVISVGLLGDIIRQDKGKVDFTNIADDLLYEYCLNDTEILETFILEYVRFLHINNLGSFRVTIASQALAAYRTSFMQDDIFIHNYDLALKLERDAYHGGRTEAFFIGKLPVDTYYYADVNSMYPSSMTGNKMPAKLRGYTENVPLDFISNRLKRFYCIMDVIIKTEEPFCSVLSNNKLLFPVGTFRTVLHQTELEYALKHAEIIHVFRCTVYDNGTLFDNYVEFFSTIKNQAHIDGNKLWRFIAKLFQNSLYGKWAQQQPHREDIGETDYDGYLRTTYIDVTKKQHGSEIYWNNRIIREYKSGETSFSCPAIAGAITANARMALYNLIFTAQISNCYYCDTDSLIVNEQGIRKLAGLLHNSDLGKLAIEQIGHYVEIFTLKDYNFHGHVRKKGVPMSAKEIKVGQWEYEQFLNWFTWLNGGMKQQMHTKTVNKQRQSEYDKGVIQTNGVVNPIRLLDRPDLYQPHQTYYE